VLQKISKQPTADTSDRSVAATAFIKMAAGDFKGIISEIGSDNPGPAFKLFRLLKKCPSIFFTMVRLLWVGRCWSAKTSIHACFHTTWNLLFPENTVLNST
jgi:hypothetical protein